MTSGGFGWFRLQMCTNPIILFPVLLVGPEHRHSLNPLAHRLFERAFLGIIFTGEFSVLSTRQNNHVTGVEVIQHSDGQTLWTRESARQMVRTWKALFQGTAPVQYKAGVEVFRQGQEARDVFLVAEGLILLSGDLAGGHDTVLGVRFPGQVIDQCAHELRIPYPLSARTLLASSVYQISAVDLRDKATRNRDVLLLSDRLLRLDLYNAAVFIAELKVSKPAQRLERFVRLLASASGSVHEGDVLRVPVPLRDDQLAEMIGCSLRHFKRIKKQLQHDGRLRIARNHEYILRL